MKLSFKGIIGLDNSYCLLYYLNNLVRTFLTDISQHNVQIFSHIQAKQDARPVTQSNTLPCASPDIHEQSSIQVGHSAANTIHEIENPNVHRNQSKRLLT